MLKVSIDLELLSHFIEAIHSQLLLIHYISGAGIENR